MTSGLLWKITNLSDALLGATKATTVNRYHLDTLLKYSFSIVIRDALCISKNVKLRLYLSMFWQITLADREKTKQTQDWSILEEEDIPGPTD